VNGKEVTYFLGPSMLSTGVLSNWAGKKCCRMLPENALRRASKLLVLEAGDPLSKRLEIGFGIRRRSTN
jgi:hypothetical protein